MAREEFSAVPVIPHSLRMEDRSRMQVAGVLEVERFDDLEAIIRTSRGLLRVTGRQLHVESMNLDAGDLSLCGTVDSLEYQDDQPRGGLFGKLWR